MAKLAGPIETYIRLAAAQRGIDPDIAVRVARSEGGLTDPVRQSDVVRNGVREQSYGPFQLYLGGGLGNRALAAGIDPRDPAQWQAGVDFALDEAKRAGWGQWYGAAKAGIGSRAGLGGKGSGAPKTYSVGPGFKGPNPAYVAPPVLTAGSGANPPPAEEEDPAAAGREMLAGLGTPMLSEEDMLQLAMQAMQRRHAGAGEPPATAKIVRTPAQAPRRFV